ncbi:dihydrofolate reductase family protein [Kordiimonas sp.]|uniref:dihydrofolate reductase family protein n=1 Tax=Kordiimonas sp. TaxID=1970157 RepID=UPI003A8D4BE1
MTTGHVYIATSLDGFVAREDHTLDWLMKQKTEGEDFGYDEFIDSVDGLVMGRGSYETVLTFENWIYTKPVLVMSATLGPDDIPVELKDKVEVTNETDPAKVMNYLDEKGWKRAYVDGGRLVQSFMRAGLVDDITLTLIPILIGKGIRLFGEIEGDVDLKLLSSQSYGSGLVMNRYEVTKT